MGAFMKKCGTICFVILLLCLLTFSGCVTRDTAQTPPDATPGPAAAGQTASPTPEPTPTPLPYDQVALADPADYGYCENDTEVFDAIELIRANASSMDGEKPTLSGTSLTDGEQRGDRITFCNGYIYLLSDNDLVIVKAEGENSQVLSRTQVGISWKGETDTATGAYQGREKVPTAVFCDGESAAVLCDWYGYNAGSGTMEYSEYVSVDILDVTDPAAPVLTASLGQDGTLRGAQVHNGSLLLVTEYQVYEDAEREKANDYIPAYYSHDLATMLSGDRICVDKEGTFPGGALIGLYDLKENRLTDIQALLGVNGDACMAGDTVLFWSNRRAESFSRDVTTPQGSGRETAYAACTDLFVYRVDGQTLSRPTVGAVNGTLAASGCLDLDNGALRCLVALDQGRYTVYGSGETVTEETQSGSAVLILDETLGQIGTIDGLSDGSPIGWAGFAGERILLTNVEQTASCAADVKQGATQLSDITEASSGRYLRRLGETGYVLYDQNEWGKMTLTICDASMRPLDSKTFASDHSSTLENHRAYLADETNDLLTLTADDSYCIYGYSQEKGIFLRADVYLNDWAWNAKGIVAGEFLYIVDTKEIRVLSLEALEEVLELTL